jgi:DNA-directed RNA polymerase subunit RPC12/RpoP
MCDKGLLPCPRCGGKLLALKALLSRSGARHGVRYECSECPRAWDFYDDDSGRTQKPQAVVREFDAGEAYRFNHPQTA